MKENKFYCQLLTPSQIFLPTESKNMALTNIELFSTAVKPQFHLSVSSEAKTLFQNKNFVILFHTVV